MGLLDNLLKSLEDDGLEKAVSRVLQNAESAVDRFIEPIEKLADQTENLSQRGESLAKHTGRAMDITTKP